MVRLRNAKARVCKRFSAFRRSRSDGNAARQTTTVRMAQVTTAVHQRQMAGMATTLRQLHRISELSQPEALTVIADLERAGIVEINRNLADAFESTITLTEESRRRLALAVDAEETGEETPAAA